jgi:hypothetical protein
LRRIARKARAAPSASSSHADGFAFADGSGDWGDLAWVAWRAFFGAGFVAVVAALVLPAAGAPVSLIRLRRKPRPSRARTHLR